MPLERASLLAAGPHSPAARQDDVPSPLRNPTSQTIWTFLFSRPGSKSADQVQAFCSSAIILAFPRTFAIRFRL